MGAGPVRRTARCARSTSPPLRPGSRSSFAPSRHLVFLVRGQARAAPLLILHSIEASQGQVHVRRLLVAIAYCLVFIPLYGRCFTSRLPHPSPCSHRALRCGGRPVSYSLHMTFPRAVRRDDSLHCSTIPSHPHPPVMIITYSFLVTYESSLPRSCHFSVSSPFSFPTYLLMLPSCYFLLPPTSLAVALFSCAV